MHPFPHSTILLLLLPLAGLAGTINLLPSARVEITNGLPVVSVELFNSGNEPVRVVSVESKIGGRDCIPQFRAGHGRDVPAASLAPGASFHNSLILTNPPANPGNYQAVTRLTCVDFGGLQFSPVIVSDFTWPGTRGSLATGAPAAGWLSLLMEPVSVGRTGTVKVEFLLLQDEPVEATVRLVLPDEFGGDDVERKVRLAPDTLLQESFEVINRKGLAGAAYPVYIIVEQDGAGVHRSISAETMVTVAKGAWAGPAWWIWGLGAVVLLGLLAACRTPEAKSLCGGTTPWRRALAHGGDAMLLVFLTGLMLWHLSPPDLIRDTVTVGGDTPAHLYLVTHLKEQLFSHGRIVSWAGGWWGGFPMFQYYFPLPYLVAALLSTVLPLNLAFKAVSVAGLVMTPLCAYLAGRLWRLPRPVPVVLALAMMPFLFTSAHTMWGVNTASTLAGMISNSWSFALMLVALASACRDAEDGVVRWRTVLFMVLVLASHFFTSLMMFLCLAVVPAFCRGSVSTERGPGEPRPRAGRGRIALRILVSESAVAIFLMAWWIVPLVAKSGFSMDFGTNWDVPLWKSFPAYGAGLLVFAGVGFARFGGRVPGLPLALLLWMLMASLVLFLFGYSLSPVFVNVRLWPFVFFALVALAAVGMGGLLARARGRSVWLLAVMAGALLVARGEDSLSGLTGPSRTRIWAKWNYSGLEDKSAASVFKTLVLPLKGTPGRLANDLCEENNQLGSSRIFELAPALAGKPILEGGLVNSALGSMYAYAIQGETSDSCAGFPTIVTPQPFDFTNATRHLELFNVKQFIARSERTKAALRGMPEWRLAGAELDWELYELMSHAGRYVFIPERPPVVVATERWKECSLEWLYTPQASEQFFIWESQVPGSLLKKAFLVLRPGGRSSATPCAPFVSRGNGGLVELAPPQEKRIDASNLSKHTDGVAAVPPKHGKCLDFPEGAESTVAERLPHLTERQFMDLLSAMRQGPTKGDWRGPRDTGTGAIRDEAVTDDYIRFKTSAIGQPHIIKVSWFPNWKVRGAARVYRVSPGFMLVFPERETVELYYGTVWSDWLGYGLTMVGVIGVGLMAVARLYRPACHRGGVPPLTEDGQSCSCKEG